MLTKQSQDFLEKLRVELLFRGKTEEEVEEKLEKVMVKSFDNIYQTSQTRRVDMRLAAYMVGVRKMAEASRFRGWI